MYCSTARAATGSAPRRSPVQVGRRVAERRVGVDGRRPDADPVERREHRRHQRCEPQRLRAPRGVVDVDHGAQPERAGGDRQHRAELRQHRRVLSADRLDHGSEPGGDARGALQPPPERGRLVGSGTGRPGRGTTPPRTTGCGPVRWRRGRRSGRSPVAVDRTDRGVGGDDAIEPGGYIDQLGHGLSVCSSIS